MSFLKAMLFVFGSILFISPAFADLTTVPHVDVSKYIGTWYQVARNNFIFEGDCYCSRQVLAGTPDGRASVYNSCNEGSVNGPLREIRGFASSDDPVSNAKFTVDFNLPHKGTYWIIGLDEDYRYAIVSDASAKALYILSRTPVLEDSLLQKALHEASQQLDISKLHFTVQQGCKYP